MTSHGKARTAAATAKRTRTKHERWAAELAVAGWTVVEAGPFTVTGEVLEDAPMPDVVLRLTCQPCGSDVFHRRGYGDVEVPLPEVLAKVNGHVCTEERS